MTTNDLWTLAIAVYGAVTGTAAIVWDIYKWRATKPRLAVQGRPDLVRTGGLGDMGQRRRIEISAANLGEQSTTITDFKLLHYDSWLKAQLRLSEKVVPLPWMALPLHRLPHRLEAGDQWTVTINQSARLENMMGNGCLYAVVVHAHRPKGVRGRLKRRATAGANRD